MYKIILQISLYPYFNLYSYFKIIILHCHDYDQADVIETTPRYLDNLLIL